MKPKRTGKKLNLGKATISRIDYVNLNNVKGKTGPTTSPYEDCTNSLPEVCPDNPTITCCTCETCYCPSTPMGGCGGGGSASCGIGFCDVNDHNTDFPF